MWKKPEYSKKQINDAGKIIIDPNATEVQREHALEVIDNWRAAHAYPMHTLAINLKRQVADIEGAVVVQRIKRLDTICGKLERFPDMQLYRVQDLGGCRVILPTVEDVYQVKHQLETSRIRHEPKTPKDYIQKPNPNTGYRSVHLIYRYKSDKIKDYNGLMVEIRPLREFCVSVFRQNQEYHVINVHAGGLFPLSTSLPVGWDGMRAASGVNAVPAYREYYYKGISLPFGRRT